MENKLHFKKQVLTNEEQNELTIEMEVALDFLGTVDEELLNKAHSEDTLVEREVQLKERLGALATLDVLLRCEVALEEAIDDILYQYGIDALEEPEEDELWEFLILLSELLKASEGVICSSCLLETLIGYTSAELVNVRDVLNQIFVDDFC